MSGSTITRMVLASLPNGRTCEAPVELWLLALIRCLDPRQLEQMMNIVDKLNARIDVTPLDDGMALVHKPLILLDDI